MVEVLHILKFTIEILLSGLIWITHTAGSKNEIFKTASATEKLLNEI